VGAARRLSAELGVSPQLAAVLVRRGHEDAGAARAFLDGSDEHDPFLLGPMREVCELILGHVRRGSRIVVHGDYDVDGVSSTAILVQRLRALGADPAWHIPSRLEEGYGLSAATVERLAATGTGLLITADCAITAADEVDAARVAGIDVVVTDHHRPGERLPDCPIVHPALSDYPFDELCAAGVAHKLSQALATVAGGPDPAHDELDLVALATVCDVVPLVGENRRLVREGLAALRRTARPGLLALMKVAGLEPATADERALGFRLGPRLNAAGRVGSAEAALELLLTEDAARAAEVSDELDLLNRDRRDEETRILFAAETARAEQEGARAYVVAGDGWHPGVIGIVASRLAERYHRPVVVIGLDGSAGRGSGRSIPGFDLHAALGACSGHLTRFGGHRAAAGLEIEADRIPAFRQAFAEYATERLSEADLIPQRTVDAIAGAGSLDLTLADELRMLAPFGAGNPEPELLVPAVRIGDVRPMGDEGQHSRLLLSGGGRVARAVAFRTTPRSLEALSGMPQDAVVRLERNEWRGSVEARPVVSGLVSTVRGEIREAGGRGFWERLEAAASATEPDGPARPDWDRRGEGLAGVAGELLQSGEPVVLVCADLARRREAIEQLVAGLAPGHVLEACDWGEALLAPAEAHLLAFDPPGSAEPGPGEGFLVRAWGPEEVAFALRVAEHRANLRPALAEVYRGLRNGGGHADGEALELILRGPGRHPRPVRVCARLLAILDELGLGRAEICHGSGSCDLVEGGPTVELSSSSTFQRAQRELELTRGLLAAEASDLPGGERVARELA
jgi:single-stranded-DNA-specific exonuclease